MSSKYIEDNHEYEIMGILRKYNLLEDLTPVSSTESELIDLVETDEELPAVEEEKVEEEQVKEESVVEEEEEDIEIPLFPTPSLRKVLPDRLRMIEGFNAIHVLPEKFTFDFEPRDIPVIRKCSAQVYLDKLAEILGCTEYKNSLPEYWFLDTLANILRKAQNDGMDRTNQKILIHWFCEIMQEIQHFDAADRQRIILRLEEVFLRAGEFIHVGGTHIPYPEEINVSYKQAEPVPLSVMALNVVRARGSSLPVREATYASNMKNLTRIIHYIYDVFSTDFQYELIRQVFTERPEYRTLDIPYSINQPKQPLKVEKPSKSAKPKKEKETGRKGGKASTHETEEYIRLMKTKEKELNELRILQEKEETEFKTKMALLPINMAAEFNDDFFQIYWPEEEAVTASPTATESARKKKGKK